MSEKPHVYVPAGETPPAELVIEDIEVGTGDEAKSGQNVEVHDAGNAWSTRAQGETFTFQLGGGQVIGGWDQGVAGMKVGGRRRLVIPPALGYGSRGAGGVIKPNETLVFVVDLIGVS
jgi:peptidylprolyl isomerase